MCFPFSYIYQQIYHYTTMVHSEQAVCINVGLANTTTAAALYISNNSLCAPLSLVGGRMLLPVLFDEPGGAELGGAVEGLVWAETPVLLLVLPPENLPYVSEGLVDGGAIAGTRLPHEELPVARVRRIQVLELHRHIEECLLCHRLVVVGAERVEVTEPFAGSERGAPDLLLKDVELVEHQDEWCVAERRVPGQRMYRFSKFSSRN